MEQTFMTIHNLTPDANILFASESISDILGYQADEVQGKSCFDYFHPDEVPFARSIHSRGVLLDKAAVLHYARILARDGRWVSCECCFTVVHDVLVACTSIYRRGEKSLRRAQEAPQIRRIFSCSPRDPRYHMLEHLSPKFKMPPMEREPRAALILNRFTRNLSVMFATNSVAAILGLRPEQVKDRSFYRCIQENCLPEAVRCLESAKANDSIAYLRFVFRDPRQDDGLEDDDDDDDEEEEEEEEEELDGDEDGRPDEVEAADGRMDLDVDAVIKSEDHTHMMGYPVATGPSLMSIDPVPQPAAASASSLNDGSCYQAAPQRTGLRPDTAATAGAGTAPRARPRQQQLPSVELEAVVSCTSDGLVVVLRKARPPIPPAHPPLLAPDYENGLFAAPWGQQPIRPHLPPEALYTFQAPFLPQHMPLRENVKAAGGPPLDQLMRSIRDVAVFAWALVGINGNLAAYGRGQPKGEARPPDGLPIWDPNSRSHRHNYTGPENQAALRWARHTGSSSSGSSSSKLGSATAPAATAAPSGMPFGRPFPPGAHGYSQPQAPPRPPTGGSYATPSMWPTAYEQARPAQQQQHHHHHIHHHYQHLLQPSAPAVSPVPQEPCWTTGPPPAPVAYSSGGSHNNLSHVMPTSASPGEANNFQYIWR